LEIICETAFSKKQLEKKLHSLIQDSVNKIGKGKYELIFKVGSITNQKKDVEMGPLFAPEKIADKVTTSKSLKAGLSPRFTFESYIMGSNNRLAYAIATAVAENPGKTYNPFFIHSGVGLGKTHLMHAIGNEIIRQSPDLNVIYITGESFTNELIEAIQSGSRGGKMSTNRFRNKFRSVDVLLIDDIQFIAGKESTQEEFFHTFNALQMAQKQIVIASDKPPRDFTNLEERITSRFSSGIISDITAPDLDTRIAILRTKRDSNKHEVTNDVIDFIAEKIDTNIRELEGAYLQVYTFAKAMGEDPTLEVAAEALGASIIKEQARKPVNLNQILKTVANYYSVRVTDIKGKRRTKNIVIPRQIAMFLMYDMTQTPYMSIGELMGGRDHTTVMHGVHKVGDVMIQEPKIRQDIANIKRVLEG
jgi:chromosomal replication initiator protein